MRKYNCGMDLAVFCLRMSEQLKQAIGNAADEAGLPMNEYIARVMAKHLKKPQLAVIPRKPGGRPRVEMALNGKH
jgi:hypothetical protein